LEDDFTISDVDVNIKFNRKFETVRYTDFLDDDVPRDGVELNIKFDTFNLEGDPEIQETIEKLDNNSLESQTWIAATVWDENEQKDYFGEWKTDNGPSDFHALQKALTISPDFPICNILTNTSLATQSNRYKLGSWSDYHSFYEISEPAIANLQGDLWRSEYQEGQVENMIFTQQHRAFQCGIGTSVYFCPRGITFDEKVQLPLRAMKKPDGSFSVYIADHYYGANNPIPHAGMAELMSRATSVKDARFLPGEFIDYTGPANLGYPASQNSEYNADAFLPWLVFDSDAVNGVSKNFDPTKTALWTPRVIQV
jgi:hypothetical protein